MVKVQHYLGDGAYVDSDGFQLRIFCDRDGETHEVFLGSFELTQLLEFAYQAGMLPRPN